MPALATLNQFTVQGGANSWLQAGVCTTYGKRIANEDAFISLWDWAALPAVVAGGGSAGPPAALFAVCDGHAGTSVSRMVSERLGDVLRAEVGKCPWTGGGSAGEAGEAQAARRATIERAFVEMDALLQREVGSAASRCGSTCVAAIVWPVLAAGRCGYKVILINLGDSRGLLYRAGRDHLAETLDHKPDDPNEKKRIRAAGGYVVPADGPTEPARLDGALAMSRAFGDFWLKADRAVAPEAQKLTPVPDVYEFDAEPGDVVVLASDGVYDMLSSAETAALAVHALAEGDDGSRAGDGCGGTSAAAATVVWASLEQGTADNSTCVVARLGEFEDGVPAAAAAELAEGQ